MVTNKSERYFFLDSYTLCLCCKHWFVSHRYLLDFNQNHNAAMCSSKWERFALQIHHIFLLDILFVSKVKLGTFLPIHRCAFNLKYIFVSSCKYNSQNENFDMVQVYKSGRSRA